MESKVRLDRKTLGILLVVAALVSMLGLSRIASSPKVHRHVIEVLEEKEEIVAKLTATTAAASVGIAALPGDASTPIADQIADLSSYLLLVVGAIMLEKALITVFGYTFFGILIPIGCVLGILYLFSSKKIFKSLAIKAVIFGFVLYSSIPISVYIGTIVDATLHTEDTIESVITVTNELQAEEENVAARENTKEKGLSERLTELGETIVNGISSSVDRLAKALKKMMDAVAAMLITACAIPVLVFLVLVWFVKTMFSGFIQ